MIHTEAQWKLLRTWIILVIVKHHLVQIGRMMDLSSSYYKYSLRFDLVPDGVDPIFLNYNLNYRLGRPCNSNCKKKKEFSRYDFHQYTYHARFFEEVAKSQFSLKAVVSNVNIRIHIRMKTFPPLLHSGVVRTRMNEQRVVASTGGRTYIHAKS